MATASLASQKGALAPADLKLPAVFSAPVEPVQARYLAPYITFAHPKRADEWAKLAAKFGRVDEGEMYLVERDTQTKLDPAKLALVCCRQYWAEINPASEVLASSYEERPKPFKEHVEAVVLVYLDDRMTIANVQFRSTKCPAAKTLADALAECQTDAWAEKSEAHKHSLVCAQPFMRYFGNVTLTSPRTSKTTGMLYRTAVASIEPTKSTEWSLLGELCASPDAQKLMDMAATRFTERLAAVDKKLVK